MIWNFNCHSILCFITLISHEFLSEFKYIAHNQWWAGSVLVLGARAPVRTEHWVITFRALKCLYKSVYIFKLILSVCKAFKTMSKFFKFNNLLAFDINLL
jgi:hypothetical protein